MGQKVSAEEPNAGAGKKHDAKLKSKKITEAPNEKVFLKPSHFLLNQFVDEDDATNCLEDDSLHSQDASTQSSQKDDANDTEQQQQKLWYDCTDLTAKTANHVDPLSFALNPNVAEISQMTALKMMQNFEEFVRIDNFLRNQVNTGDEDDEKTMDENSKEVHLNTLTFDDELVWNKISHRDEMSSDNRTCVPQDTWDDVKSTDSEESDAKNEKAIVAADENVQSILLRETKKKEEQIEVMELRGRLERLESERNEANARLRSAVERCEVYEKESKCLEATLGSLEERLRTLASELSDEVGRGKDLEQRLSRALQRRRTCAEYRSNDSNGEQTLDL